jgi:hypothetical protein
MPQPNYRANDEGVGQPPVAGNVLASVKSE